MRLIATMIVALAVVPSLAGADDAWPDAPAAPPGAMSCSGCHGAGSSLELDRLSADEVFEAMAAFRSGAREATVMNRIAAGFDADEIALIAAWIAEER